MWYFQKGTMSGRNADRTSFRGFRAVSYEKNEKKSNCGDSCPSFMFVCGHYVKQGYIEWSVFWLQIRLFWHRNTHQELAAQGFRWVCRFFLFLDVSSQGTPDHCGLIPCGPIHRTAAASWNKMGGKKKSIWNVCAVNLWIFHIRSEICRTRLEVVHNKIVAKWCVFVALPFLMIVAGAPFWKSKVDTSNHLEIFIFFNFAIKNESVLQDDENQAEKRELWIMSVKE